MENKRGSYHKHFLDSKYIRNHDQIFEYGVIEIKNLKQSSDNDRSVYFYSISISVNLIIIKPL